MTGSEYLYREFADRIEEFLTVYCEDELHEFWHKYPKEKADIWVDMSHVAQWNQEIRDIIVGYNDEFSHGDVCEAFEKVLCELDTVVDVTPDPERVTVRFWNLNQTYDVGGYWAEDLGNYMAVAGQISKSTKVRPRYSEIAFVCQRCGTVTTTPQHSTEDEQLPGQCNGCERKGPFVKDDEKSSAVNHQMLIIEQPADELGPEEDPDELAVRVEGDMVKQLQSMGVTSGSRITVSGVLGTSQDRTATGSNEWLLEVSAVEVDDSDFDPSSVTDEERERIRAIADGELGDTLELLSQSIAPSLKGHDTIEKVTHQGEERTKLFWVKAFAGLACLFQGWRKPNNDGTYSRGTSHMFLVGDPSTGKSTIMQAIESISPRAAGTSGKGASAAGLTAAAVQTNDFGISQWQLEAGVLVKAHGGVATIDELDKISEDVVNSMHSALERQRVQISKAGIHATLRCETSLLAAANPKDSRFDEYHDEYEQIDMVGSLLDRFDLIFVLKDTPDATRDRVLAEHVTEARTKAGLMARGDLDPEEGTPGDEIDPELLTKWVTLAREYEPVIKNEGVKEQIVDFYVEIRNGNESDAVPATARSLDGLLRLAEASARMRLSEEITEYDASVAIAGVKASLEDIGIDPDTGDYDVDRKEGRVAKGERDARKQVRVVLENRDGQATTEEIADALEWDVEKAEYWMNKLSTAGKVYLRSRDDGWRWI